MSMDLLIFIFLHTGLTVKSIPSQSPLHPLFVHFPIVLTLLIPIFAIFVLIKFKENNSEISFWNFIIVLNLILVIFSYMALFTGDIEHEILEHSPYLKQAIEQHEKFAESFFIFTIFILAISFLGHIRFSFYKVMRILTIILLFVIGYPLVLYTSYLGGKIVYELDAPFYRKKIIDEIKTNGSTEHNHETKKQD